MTTENIPAYNTVKTSVRDSIWYLAYDSIGKPLWLCVWASTKSEVFESVRISVNRPLSSSMMNVLSKISEKNKKTMDFEYLVSKNISSVVYNLVDEVVWNRLNVRLANTVSADIRIDVRNFVWDYIRKDTRFLAAECVDKLVTYDFKQ